MVSLLYIFLLQFVLTIFLHPIAHPYNPLFNGSPHFHKTVHRDNALNAPIIRHNIVHAVCFVRWLALSWKYPCWLRETDGAYFSTLLCRLIPPLIFSHLSCSFLRPLIPRFFLSPSLPSQPYHSPFISGHLPLVYYQCL